MRKDLLVVAVEEQATPRVRGRPVRPGLAGAASGIAGRIERLDVLRGEGRDVPERPLAHPGQHRPALGRGDLDPVLGRLRLG